MIRVRPATVADIPTLMAIEKQSPSAAHWDEVQYRAAVRPAGGPQRVTLVAEEDAVRGFIVARVLGEEWEIENVVVANSVQRRGWGQRLVEELLRQAGGRGARVMFLEVRESNQAARRLYAKSGFVGQGRRKSYYTAPEEDALLFRYDFSTAAPERG